MNKDFLQQELISCYSDQAEHFANTRKKQRPEFTHIKTYLEERVQAFCKKPICILELGCGAGRLYPQLQEIFGNDMKYIGNDIAPGMLEQAHASYKGTLKHLDKNNETPLSLRAKTQRIIADMLTMLRALPDDSMDVIISIASLQHLMTSEQRQLVRLHSYRVLKYGGHLISVNRSYSNRFLKKYRKQQLASLAKSLISPHQKRNDLIIPRKDPHRQNNQKIRHRYYHLFTLHELRQLTSMSGFVLEDLGYIMQNSKFDQNNWRDSRNSILIARKSIV